MQAAVSANVVGVEADCGGLMTCGTCHVYLLEPHATQLPPPSDEELGILDFTTAPRQANSRLSCQVMLTEGMDGLTVELPSCQH